MSPYVYNYDRVLTTKTPAVFTCIWCMVYRVYHAFTYNTGEVVYSVSQFNQKHRENLTADVKDLMATSFKRLVLDVRGLDQSSLRVAAGAEETLRPSDSAFDMARLESSMRTNWLDSRGGNPYSLCRGGGKTQPHAI